MGPGVRVSVDDDQLLQLAAEANLAVQIVPLMDGFVAEGGRVLERQLKLLDRDITREFDDPLGRTTAMRPADLS